MANNRERKIKVGDIVQVIKPDFFICTKYENNFQDIYSKLLLDEGADKEVIKKMMAIVNPHAGTGLLDSKAEFNLFNHICRGIAAYRMELAKKTGSVKSIYTESMPHYTKAKFRVVKISQVCTGTYQRGDGGYDAYTGEYDYEPAALLNRTYHRILWLSDMWSTISNINDHAVKIEDVNVELIESDEPIPYNPGEYEDYSEQADEYWKQMEQEYMKNPY